MKDGALSIFSLFASTSTLVCCALPVLLVTLGFGAVVAGAVSTAPWLVPLSENSAWIFLGAGLLIAVNWVVLRRQNQTAACDVPQGVGDIPQKSNCERASRFSWMMLWASTAIYGVGFFVAFFAVPVGDATGWF